MEVIFDTPNLKPRLSPTMRTTLSVISLIANSLIEANKCMKERLADEAGPPSTLDQVMQQSGLKIPGLEEALARLMGGGDDAKQAASMIVNTPDPVKLLQTFAANYWPASTSAEPPKSGPIVTPPPAANTPPTASAAASGLAPFRADFTREGREAAKVAAAASAGLPQHRPDFTREFRQSAHAHVTGPGQSVAVAGAAGRLALVGGVARQLDTIRRQRTSFEDMVRARLVELEAKLAKLREEFDQLHAALLSKAESKADEANAAETAAVAVESATAAVDAAAAGTMTVDDAPVAAQTTGVVDTAANVDADATTVAAQPTDAATMDPLPPAATAEEVVQAIELIEEFAAETTAAEARQLARIAAVEREVARMRDLVQSAREAHAVGARRDTAAHG